MADFDSRREALRRRKALLDSLIEKAAGPISPGQMVGDHFVPIGLGQALAPAIQSLAASYAGKRADKEAADLEKERTAALVAELQRVQGLPQNEQPAALAASEFAETREMGNKALLKALEPKELKMFEGTLYDPYTGKQGPKIEGRRNLKAHRGQLYDPQTGDLVGGQIGQAAAGPSVTVNLPPLQRELDKSVGKGVGGRLVDQTLGGRQAAINNIRTAQQLQAISENEMATGQAAPLGVFASQLASSFGVQAPEWISNAESYDAGVQRAVSDFIMQDPKGITQAEADRFAKSWAPLTTTPQGRQQILRDVEEINRRKLQDIDKSIESLREKNPNIYEQIQIDPAMNMEIPQPRVPSTLAPSGAVVPKRKGKFLEWEN